MCKYIPDVNAHRRGPSAAGRAPTSQLFIPHSIWPPVQMALTSVCCSLRLRGRCHPDHFAVESVQLHRPPPRQATGGELCALRCKPSHPPLEAASHLTTWSVSLERSLQSLYRIREPIPRYLRWPRPHRFLRLPGRAIVQGPRQWLHNPHQADRRHVATHHSRGGSIE